MATRFTQRRMAAIQTRSDSDNRSAFVGLCNALPKRPGQVFYDAASKAHVRPWRHVQEPVLAAIDAGAAWADVQAFYDALRDEAWQRYADREQLQVTGAFQAFVRESSEAVTAAVDAQVAQTNGSALDRAAREVREAIAAGELFLTSLCRRRREPVRTAAIRGL